jgi:hypothetical protein
MPVTAEDRKNIASQRFPGKRRTANCGQMLENEKVTVILITLGKTLPVAAGRGEL